MNTLSKKFMLIFFIFIPCVEANQNENLLEEKLNQALVELPYSGKDKIFELIIGNYNQVTFTLFNESGNYLLRTETRIDKELSVDSEINNWEIKKSVKKLSQTEFKKHIAYLESALSYNTLDDAGLVIDGTSWCLETHRGTTNLNACFWSPSYYPKKRGINGLYELANFLWSQNELVNQFKLDDF